MPPTATAPSVANRYEKIEGEAKGDALVMATKGELIDALLRVPELCVYREIQSQEIAFGVGDSPPRFDEGADD